MIKNEDIIHLPLRGAEAKTLLHLLALASDSERCEPEQRDTSTWLAQRLGRLVDPEHFGVSTLEGT